MKIERRVRFAVALLVLVFLASAGVLLLELVPSGTPVAAQGPGVLPTRPQDVKLSAAQVSASAAGSDAPPGRGMVNSVTAGPRMTQVFTLRAGWNAIYLEIEPVNTSPLINLGTKADPVMVHERSTMETVFDGLACDGCLEGVWAWNVPATNLDYIVDPNEEPWDQPGWRQYVPRSIVGPDGVSRGVLTNLLSLHANTAYLIKLQDHLKGDLTLQVSGVPVLRNPHWTHDDYNLAGFPIAPGAAPTVATITAGSPITEVRRLQPDGQWVPLSAADTLASGAGYLVWHGAGDTSTAADYAGPLAIAEPVSDGLAFTRGAGARQQDLTLTNLSPDPIFVSLSLTQPVGGGVALRVTGSITAELKAGPATISLERQETKSVQLTLISREQAADGEALLEILSPELGVRRVLPVRAEAASLAGLWVGEVIVNDVSEGRLGATNIAGGRLTAALRPKGGSGIRGAAELQERIAGNTSSVALTLTLALPPAEIVTPTVPTAEGLHLRGFAFEDTNQNGERDGGEPGLEGRTVTLTPQGSLTGAPALTATTRADGLYLFQRLKAGEYGLALAPPPGYTALFPVTAPITETDQPAPPSAPNAWPVTVRLDEAGVTSVSYAGPGGPGPTATYSRLAEQTRRVEPFVNFGFAPAHTVSLWTGDCTDPRDWRRDLGTAVNGVLLTTLDSASLNSPRGPVQDELLGSAPYAILVEGPTGAAACGELVVGAPTQFTDGAGSEFSFRLILRVGPNGQAAILPEYELKSGQRISSANFSGTGPVTATNAVFGHSAAALDFPITIAANDPLNPYKHKYQPDHDNLDARFNPIDLATVDPSAWESYEVQRRIGLELTELPPFDDATPADAVAYDWGGEVYGGRYREVIRGIHKNDITVKGYFIIRQVLPWEDVVRQAQDARADAGTGGATTPGPPSPPVVTITASGADALPAWQPVTRTIYDEPTIVTGYPLWKGDDPYFNAPSDTANPAEVTDTQYTDAGVMADLKAVYYLVLAKDGRGQRSMPSNRTGKFSFTLVAGGVK